MTENVAMTLAAAVIVGVSLIFGILGVLFGLWKAYFRWPSLQVVLKAAPLAASLPAVAERSADDAGESASEEQLVLAEQILAQLYDTTQGLAAGVDHHNNQVTEINAELTQLESPSPIVLKTIERLVFANREMQTQLVQAEKRLQSQATQLQSLSNDALTDALTGAANRRAFDMILARQHAEYQTGGEPLSLIILDIDKFKLFNDEYGHQVGDEILRSVAKVLRTKTDADDVLARYGGEEFAAVLPGETLTTARNVAERLRTATAKSRWTIDNQSLGVTLSVGVAQLLPGESIEDLIGRADKAMYASKAAGRNCGHGHDGQICFPLESKRITKNDPGAGKRPPLEKKPLEKKLSPKPPAVRTDAGSLQSDAEQCREALRRAVENQPDRSAVEKLPGGALCLPGSSGEKMQRQPFTKNCDSVVSALLVQVDRFEQIVTAHGEAMGKKVIASVLRLLHVAAREFNHSTQLHDDAIALLAPGASFADLSAIARKVQQGSSRCVQSTDEEVCLFTVSIGVAEGAEGESEETFIQRAKSAMVAAQERGGNGCFFHRADATHPLPV